MTNLALFPLIAEYQRTYDAEAKDQIWQQQSKQFRDFWATRVLSPTGHEIGDEDCDKIIRILDTSAKGHTKDTEAVARVMVTQYAWRRIFNAFHVNRSLAAVMTKILESAEPDRRASLIDELYSANQGQIGNLTGPSGNVVNAFLAAYDPFANVSVISLKDRRALIDFLGLVVPFDWSNVSIGRLIVATNKILLDGVRALGVQGSARTVSRFCYFGPVAALWKGEHTIRRPDKSVSVTVPSGAEAEVSEESSEPEIRESLQMQALIAKIGASMGFSIWLPRSDRARVLKMWTPTQGQLLSNLPFAYDSTTMKTIEQIDVIWVRKRSIVRAFEVEHTTSIYSGLLRMADLVALQPDINIRLHIVAPATKRDKVMQEIQRPVFSLLEGRALAEMCTFISYDNLKALGQAEHLAYLPAEVLQDYEEKAESDSTSD